MPNLVQTKYCEKSIKGWLKHWQMGTHMLALNESFPMNTNMTGFRWLSRLFFWVLVPYINVVSALKGLILACLPGVSRGYTRVLARALIQPVFWTGSFLESSLLCRQRFLWRIFCFCFLGLFNNHISAKMPFLTWYANKSSWWRAESSWVAKSGRAKFLWMLFWQTFLKSWLIISWVTHKEVLPVRMKSTALTILSASSLYRNSPQTSTYSTLSIKCADRDSP